MRAQPARTTCAHFLRALPTRTSYVRLLRALPSRTSCAYFLRTLPARASYVRFLRALPTRTSGAHFLRAPPTRTSFAHFLRARTSGAHFLYARVFPTIRGSSAGTRIRGCKGPGSGEGRSRYAPDIDNVVREMFLRILGPPPPLPPRVSRREIIRRENRFL